MKKDNCEGFCPVCHSDNVDYKSIELRDGMAYFPYTCKNCGTHGEEWYNLKFAGHLINDTEIEYLNLDEKRKEMGIKISPSKKRKKVENKNVKISHAKGIQKGKNFLN